ncbi:UNVERIFIED_CONTAM: hypothetical protein GTU68_010690 [Idotea baltica]|nr:hypothetical protein [Idotea baltica]
MNSQTPSAAKAMKPSPQRPLMYCIICLSAFARAAYRLMQSPQRWKAAKARAGWTKKPVASRFLKRQPDTRPNISARQWRNIFQNRRCRPRFFIAQIADLNEQFRFVVVQFVARAHVNQSVPIRRQIPSARIILIPGPRHICAETETIPCAISANVQRHRWQVGHIFSIAQLGFYQINAALNVPLGTHPILRLIFTIDFKPVKICLVLREHELGQLVLFSARRSQIDEVIKAGDKRVYADRTDVEISPDNTFKV